MLNALRNLLRAPEQKASRTGQLIALQSAGRARWTPRDYAALAREGYHRNAIVHRAVKLVAENAASVPFLRLRGRRGARPHPLLDLLARPNPRQDGAAFLEAVCAHLLLAGNAYVEAVTRRRRGLRELYALRPDRMRVVPGAGRLAGGLRIRGRAAARVRFEQSAARCRRSCISTQFHPLDDHYGLAPLEAAAVAVDTHNAAAKWNKALLDNAARPSGALVYAGPEGAVLSDDQFERLKRELEEQYQGAAQCRPAAAAGRRARLEGDVAVAEGHGFPGGQAHRGARDRARLRRAADAARHSRRQHLCELPGGQPRVLARRPCCRSPTRIGACAGAMARAGVRRRAAARRSTPTGSRRSPPTAPRCGSRSPRRRSSR